MFPVQKSCLQWGRPSEMHVKLHKCMFQATGVAFSVAPIENITTFGSLLELQRLKDHVMAECKNVSLKDTSPGKS